ncbi:MAG: cytochrome c family protein [Erythrobacter sp.]|nr:cytochrome c family protein [Erythrobacter sp.]
MGQIARPWLLISIILLAGALAWGQSDARAVTPSPGERAYQKCYTCHSLEGPDPDMQGPSLKGIVGRKVASEAGFTYSQALRSYARKQKAWDRKALGAFIADPQAVIPGNRMGFFGIRNAQEREELIAYLAAAGQKD